MSCARKVGKVGHGGGQVVNVFAFYSNHQSSNPAEVYSFFSEKLVIEKNENKQKDASDGPLK